MEIKITCSTRDSLKLDDLKDFQKNLKVITEAELVKLKQSIIDHGFTFPVFVWKDYIINGHQRVKAVRSLINDDGYTIGNIPVVRIQAKNRQEAAKKLLLENSRYAEMSQDGFEEFINDFEIDLSQFGDVLELPDISMAIEDDSGDTNDNGGDGEFDNVDEFDLKHKCPKCGYEFD